MPDSPAQSIIEDTIDRLPQRTALLLDFDGTLVDICATPDAVEVSRELIDVVASAARRLGGRIALVSGRSVQQLVALWPALLPGFVIAGSHGQELSIDGIIEAPDRTGLFGQLAALAACHFGADQGVMIEEKTFGLAVHYRLAPHQRERVLDWTQGIAAEHGLLVQQGDMVCELRPRGADKGDAVRAIMALERFQGSVPVYIGDDLTDIPAFQAAQAMGGTAISVGARTAAYSDERLDGVADVLRRIGEVAA